ncbi:MAG: hypothetical protein FJW90_05075 [Actinobacteria bacterium]|nr:hypothetical protein [Actinomycetota bacterium]
MLGALVLCAAVVIAPVAATGAKKKAKLKPFAATATVNAGIPNGAAATKSVPVLSTITVPKK